MTFGEVADLIERFLQNKSLYPQEWNDFVESPQRDAAVNKYRERCYELDPFVNRPDPVDAHAIAELQQILGELRGKASETCNLGL